MCLASIAWVLWRWVLGKILERRVSSDPSIFSGPVPRLWLWSTWLASIQIVNATYGGIYDAPITLVDGLQDGQLAEVASEELGPVSLDDLMGTQWRLHRLNFDQEPLVDVTISAEFAEGTVSGTGGCNSYSANVTSSGGQLLAVGPVATTAMACDDDREALETAYLAALQSATEWRFYPGQLAIGYTATGGDQGTLFFTPVESVDSGPTSE